MVEKPHNHTTGDKEGFYSGTITVPRKVPQHRSKFIMDHQQFTNRADGVCAQKSLKGNTRGSGYSSSTNLTRFFQKADLGDETSPERPESVKSLIRYPGLSDSKAGVSVTHLNKILAETGLCRSGPAGKKKLKVGLRGYEIKFD